MTHVVTLPAGLLRSIGRGLGLHGGHAIWWHDHAAEVISSAIITLELVGSLVLVVVVWRFRNRLFPGYKRASSGRLWAALVVAVLALYGLTYSLMAPVSDARDVYRLHSTIVRRHGPIWADLYSAQVLDYLSGYGSPSVHVLVREHDNGDRTYRVLKGRKGCVVVDQPELDVLTHGIEHKHVPAYSLLQRPPVGWTVVTNSPSEANPLESVGLLCARTQS